MKMGYRACLDWLLDNDDCEWLNEPDDPISVTAALVTDIFGKDEATVTADLRKRRLARSVTFD